MEPLFTTIDREDAFNKEARIMTWLTLKEGIVVEFYKDTKKSLTYGIGHLVTPIEKKNNSIRIGRNDLSFDEIRKIGRTAVSRFGTEKAAAIPEEVFELFVQDYLKHRELLIEWYPNLRELGADYTKVGVVLGMIYQMGKITRFKTFTTRVRKGDFKAIGDEGFKSWKWHKDTPGRAEEAEAIIKAPFGTEDTWGDKQCSIFRANVNLVPRIFGNIEFNALNNRYLSVISNDSL